MPTVESIRKISEIVKTTQNKNVLLAQIDFLSRLLSSVNAPKLEDVQNSYPTIYKILLGKITLEELSQLRKDLESIEELVVNVPVILPETVEELARQWCNQNASPEALVSIVRSESLVGGVTTSYKGQYRDLSLNKIISQKINA